MKILGIDVGGSGIKGAIVDTANGNLLTERHRIETPKPATPVAIAETISAIASHFEWKDAPIGIGFPSVVQHGVVHTATNIDKSWIGVEADKLFSDITKCACHLINDADAAGLAEMNFGAGIEYFGVVMVITVGTGLGTSLFSNRELVPNFEFGHITIHGDIAEKYTSDAARKRDELSWKKWGKRFNEYLTKLEHLTWPDNFIVGGGASKKFDKFKDELSTRATTVPAQLKNEAGIVGAAYAVNLHYSGMIPQS